MYEGAFNQLNLYYRECFTFVKKENEEENICGCNRPRDPYHKDKDTKSNDTKWEMRLHTLQRLNPAHGTLPNGALFTRLALDTPEEKVEKLLLEVWKIPKPQLIISIVGGNKYFKLSDRLESNFINGFIHVALKSNAWLITNGYNVGIVQLVGQAINKVKLTNPKKQITAIAVCKWGSVQNVEKLTKDRNKEKEKEKQESKTSDDEQKENERERGERDLDMNHSHYLMFDDGTFRHYGLGGYRTQLCVHMAKFHLEDDFPMPVVTVVFEGGKGTIRSIYRDLKAHIPVVIIDGSGRIADFFKKWLLYTKEFDDDSEDSDIPYDIDEIDEVVSVTTCSSVTFNTVNEHHARSRHIRFQLDASENALQNKFDKYKEQLKTELRVILAHDDDSNKKKRMGQPTTKSNDDPFEKSLNTAVNQVMYCLQSAVRSGITVFDLNTDDDLSATILRSICKSHQKHFENKEKVQNDDIEIKLRKFKTSIDSPDRQRQSNVREYVNNNSRNAQRSNLLRLAMNWNCIDVAKELILKSSLNNIMNKEKAFTDALTENLPTFVYEFLKLGMDPSKIFFPKDKFFDGQNRYSEFIKSLYTTEAVNRNTTHLSWFIELKEKCITTTDDLNTILTTLIGDYMHKLYFDSDERENRYRLYWGLNEENNESNHSKGQSIQYEHNLIDRENREIIKDYIMRDLFLWSILMNYIDLAKVLLCYIKYRICAALIATKILKQYHSKAVHGELKANYIKNADYFERYAIDCITQCEKNDSDQTCQIVLQRIELYGNVTCLQVAADAKDKLFIATPCCVQAMRYVWYDKIYPKESRSQNYISTAIGVFSFGLAAPFVVTYGKRIR
ncbi:unnamed protein product, partial [Rotaria sp. Silwood1]